MGTPDYVASLERNLLGICLLDPARLREAERICDPADFADPRHTEFFNAAAELMRRGADCGAIGVGLELKRLGKLDPDDEAYLASLVAGANADPMATKELARRVREEAVRRGAQRALATSDKDLADRSKALIDTLGDLRRNISELERSEGTEELPPITAAVDEILATLDTGVDPGTPTGLPPLDDAIQGGIKPSQLVVLAGGTGSGKTSLATQIALGAAAYAKRRGKGWVLIFSMEMSAPELVIRMVSQVVPIVDGYRPPDGFSRRDRDRVREGLGKLRELPMRIEVPRQSTVTAIRAAVERHVGEHGAPALVVVDHIGLMKDPRVKGGRTEEVGSITRSLKEMAMQLNVPVLALSQLNREAGKREGQKPQLTDLRESGCLTGESRVFLPDLGEYRRIEDLVGQSGFRVLALDPATWRFEPREVTNAFSTGRKPVFRMRLRSGRSIRATANHKFRTLDGWHRLDELAVGARLATPRTLPSPTEQTLSDAKLGLLGHLIGDGCVLPLHTIQYTTRERDLAEIVERLALEAFGAELAPRIHPERSWFQVYLPAAGRTRMRVRNPIAAWFDRLGIFGLRSHEKRVPSIVFAQPRESIARFLRHLWATDGCLKAEGVYPVIYYATSSDALARDIVSLLLRLDIVATHRVVPQRGKGRDQHHVVVTGRDQVLTFLREVGTVGVRRGLEAERITERLDGRGQKCNYDVIPREAWPQIVVPAMAAAGVTARDLAAGLGMSYAGSALYKSGIGHARAERVAAVVDSDELRALARSEVHWDEIVAVEPDGEAEVYDLTVEGLHNFVAEDLVLHNSIEQDGNIVLFVHRPSHGYTDFEKRRIEEEQGAEAFVLVAKNRAGPTAEVPFVWVGPRYQFRLTEEYMARNPAMVDRDALVDHTTPVVRHEEPAPADLPETVRLLESAADERHEPELPDGPLFDGEEDLFA